MTGSIGIHFSNSGLKKLPKTFGVIFLYQLQALTTFVANTCLVHITTSVQEIPPEGSTPYDGLYGKAPPERGIFSRLQVYERVGRSAIWVCEGAQKG